VPKVENSISTFIISNLYGTTRTSEYANFDEKMNLIQNLVGLSADLNFFVASKRIDGNLTQNGKKRSAILSIFRIFCGRRSKTRVYAKR
jgi:hypothetical protein